MYEFKITSLLVNEQARSKNVVYIFTTLEKLTSFEEVAQNPAKRNETMYSCTDPSTFYKDPGFGGSNPLNVSPGNDANLYALGLYQYYRNIESVESTYCNEYTKLFGTPGELWLACCGSTWDLAVYGWDDQAEYLKVTP